MHMHMHMHMHMDVQYTGNVPSTSSAQDRIVLLPAAQTAFPTVIVLCGPVLVQGPVRNADTALEVGPRCFDTEALL